MDFAYDETTASLIERLEAFMEEFVLPTEEAFFQQRREMRDPWSQVPLVEELKQEARARGLWNLFLPRTHAYGARSEEHTSELQSHVNLVCRLLLEKKK